MFKAMWYTEYKSRVLAGYRGGLRVYRGLLDKAIRPGSIVVHLGCGHDIENMVSSYGADCEIHGVDPDASAIAGYCGNAWLGSGEELPFGDSTVDLVFSEYVLEHLESPDAVFHEISRVLVDGGLFISVAPNFWSYKSLAAHYTPLVFHKTLVRILRPNSGRTDGDVYPTEYKANTAGDLRNLGFCSRLHLEQIQYVDNGPTWFQRIPVLFEIGILVHFILKIELLKKFRCNLVVVFKKVGQEPRREFGIRCVRCNASPMLERDGSYYCSSCNNSYPLSGSYWIVS